MDDFKLPPSIWKCVLSTSKKDLLYAEEIGVISGIFFQHLSGQPIANKLGFENGNDFDSLIRGWTRYWNDIFQPNEELDANLIKALIASESSFNQKPKKSSAFGLIQVIPKTRIILGDLKGELKDHFIIANKERILDPSVNICAGIRWLFHKRGLVTKRQRKEANWEETVAEYKNYFKEYKKDPEYHGMGVFRKYYKELIK